VRCNPENVILDAKGAGRVITIDDLVKPTVDCFTITGGDAEGLGGDPTGADAGGGIYGREAAPILVNNIITGNTGCSACMTNYGRGGGIYLLNASDASLIEANLVAKNVGAGATLGWGGGIMLRQSDTRVRRNTIRHNTGGVAGAGGGIMVLSGTATLDGNEILHNSAGTAVMCNGGGIYVRSSTPVIIERNLFEYNQALQGSGDPTLISKGGGIFYTGNPTVTATIRDNILVHNLASADSSTGQGGGIYVSGLVSPSVVSGNRLESNIAGHNDDGSGGGIYVEDSKVTVLNNEFTDNSATWAGSHGQGGGLYVNGGAALILSNTITNNYGAGFVGLPSSASGYGGGIAISGSLSIVQDNWIKGNGGTNADNLGAGGGVYGFRGVLRIVDNTIAENHATLGDWGSGGGMYLEEMPPTVEANIILDNVAAHGSNGHGGGVRLAWCPVFTLTNNIVARNAASELGSGVGVAGNSTGILAFNTLSGNHTGDGSGVDVRLNSDVWLYNNIIADHNIGILNADPAGSSVEAKYTLYEANTTLFSAGVLDVDPVSGPAALLADYHLAPASGAIDHATGSSWVTRDVDGDPRPIGTASDVGADEYKPRIYLPLVMRNWP
jgi:hypothetical protein